MELEETKEIANCYFNNEDYINALELLLNVNEIEQNNALTIATISSCYHELVNYDEALNWAKKAYTLQPRDPFVRWNYAGALFSNQFYREAIKLWKMLINRGVYKIGFVDCSEGLRWARSIYNDCYYRIGLSYYYLKNYKKSIEYLNKNLELRSRGINSLYSKKEVIRDLKRAKVAFLSKSQNKY